LLEVHDQFLQQILNVGILPVLFIDPSTPFFLRGDALRIKPILNNLISNAIKFSQDGGTIELTVTAGQAVDHTIELLWQVKDDGRGIPLRLQDKIFEPYQQAEIGDATELKGTGLGLAISRQLVEQMGGQISVESSPGQGACFSFNLFLKLDDKAPDLDLLFSVLKDKKLVMASTLKGVREQLSVNFLRWGPELIEEDNIIDAIELAKTSDILITDTIHTLHAEDVERINTLPRSVMLVVMTVETPAWLDDITGRKVRVLKLPAAVLDVIAPVVEMLSGSPIALTTQVSTEEPIDLGHHHVLSVDDNLVNLTVVEKLLQSMGVEVVSEHGGGSALELLYKQHQAFSLVLLDCEMPGIDGFEMCRLLREFESRENLKPLPVIALTAHALSEIKERCQAAGMNDTLFKPVSRETLARLLGKY
jgi:CheY-like chemotaxis protein/anti-sigma regulatory factor (Ser/Thr protein kinase)